MISEAPWQPQAKPVLSHHPLHWGSHPDMPLPQHPLPRRRRCRDVWGAGLLISHIILGILHSLGELENVIVKVFLNICLLSKKML